MRDRFHLNNSPFIDSFIILNEQFSLFTLQHLALWFAAILELVSRCIHNSLQRCLPDTSPMDFDHCDPGVECGAYLQKNRQQEVFKLYEISLKQFLIVAWN